MSRYIRNRLENNVFGFRLKQFLSHCRWRNVELQTMTSIVGIKGAQEGQSLCSAAGTLRF